MIFYITDNPEIKKIIKSNIELTFQIYDWRVNLSKEKIDIEEVNFQISKKIKKKIIREKILKNKTIIAIVAPSNYKLIYDLLDIEKEFNKKIKIYSWDSYIQKRRTMLKVDRKEIKNLFNEYIQRGYLTSLLYNKLTFFNFQRIEQFISIIAINIINQINKDNKEEEIDINNLKTTTLINILLNEMKPINKIIDILIYNQRKFNIKDPFLGEIIFLNKSSKLYKKIEKLNGTKIRKTNISESIILLNKILPLTDILKTLRYLEDNFFIKTNLTNKQLNSIKEVSIEDIKYYYDYVDKDIWDKIYQSKTFSFNNMFPPIEVEELNYECPLCGSTEYNSSPMHFFCSDTNCKLYIPRIISPGGVKKSISDNDFLKLINHGETLIKNKVGGYNKYFLIKKDNKFKIIPKINKEIKENI